MWFTKTVIFLIILFILCVKFCGCSIDKPDVVSGHIQVLKVERNKPIII